MKLFSALAAIPLAVLLLTWLSLQSLDTNAELFDRVLGEMDRFSMLEASLHRDVLNAHLEAVEETLHVRVAIHVDVRVWMRVAREELLEPERRG